MALTWSALETNIAGSISYCDIRKRERGKEGRKERNAGNGRRNTFVSRVGERNAFVSDFFTSELPLITNSYQMFN